VAEDLSLFTNDAEAIFVRRPNRFLIMAVPILAQGENAEAGNTEELSCHCPNPGRLIEFTFPGTRLILEKRAEEKVLAKTAWTAVGLYHRKTVVPLFSSRANKAAEKLILKEIIPGLRDIIPEYSLNSGEGVAEHSRFDFLCVDHRGQRHLVEVKSCSLVEYDVAMFPDAPSSRALKHLEELAELTRRGYRCHVLFVIVHSKPSVFIPNLHTDPEFAAALGRYGHVAVLPGTETLSAAGGKVGDGTRKKSAADTTGSGGGGPVSIHAALIRCNRKGKTRLLSAAVPVDLSQRKLAESNGGNYLILLELPEGGTIEIGALGLLPFKAGWYVYAGSARKNLSQRVNRHLRHERKQKHWHMDYLTPWAGKMKALPILSYRNLECDLARDLEKLGGQGMAGFGSSDCGCNSHLFYFKDPPMGNRDFVDMVLRYRHREGLVKD
jgi:sugar fermentation stimulation protein A